MPLTVSKNNLNRPINGVFKKVSEYVGVFGLRKREIVFTATTAPTLNKFEYKI